GFPFEHRGEAVHRDQDGAPPCRVAVVEQFGDALMIGEENLAAARLALSRANGLGARDSCQLADPRYRAGPAGMAVAVDDETRIDLQYGGRIERLGQKFGDPGD